jgi:hypothetical protein
MLYGGSYGFVPSAIGTVIVDDQIPMINMADHSVGDVLAVS